MTGAEKLSILPTALLALAATLGYAIDSAGFGVTPVPVFLLSLIAASFLVWSAPESTRSSRGEAVAWAGIVLFVLTVVIRTAWPALLPPGRGPDLAHHLLLVDYIEHNGHLVHDRALEGAMGEMAHYTPGAHLLAVLSGKWLGTDGLRAFFPLLAFGSALTAGYLFLIARRLLLPMPYAVAAVLLLFLPVQYFYGAFTHDSFLAQAAATFFAVSAWWACIAWDQDRSNYYAIVISIFLVAVFLTWPVFVGPLAVMFAVLSRARPGHMAIALAPTLILALIHVTGRWGWVGIVRTSGAVLAPGTETLGWLFPALALIGLLISARHREARVSLILLLLIAVQALTLFVLARANSASTPYMAFKMMYLAVYPMAMFGAIALGRLRSTTLGWILASVLIVAAVRPALMAPRVLPIVTLDLYEAGTWVRTNLGQGCVDYLVGDAETAYWLHLAVLGNSRSSARADEMDRYDPRSAVGPWLTAGGRGYAIADARTLPDEVRSRVEIEKQFGNALVIKRPGAVTCR
ncbi:MAG TPA: hypothetical protein VJ691_02200 [Vicinamibacterales bacterium]|nr:hypothetical protein [Vicinamibacterales bacterium]